MYNRYIPQSDGSFRKNRMPENGKNQPYPSQQGKKQQPSGHPLPATAPPSKPNQEQRNPMLTKHRSAESFLKQLLPEGLDTGDLLIAVLLLLMAGDCQEEKNTALLTLALYLFL